MKFITGRSGLVAAALCAMAVAGCDSIKDVRDEPYTALPTPTVVVQGKITGLSTRRFLTLQNNGNGDLAKSFIATPGTQMTPFTFGAVPVGTPYKIEVKAQPFGQICEVNDGEGTVTSAEAMNITVECGPDPDVERYDVRVSTPLAFENAAGAKVTLTTEDGVFDATPVPGQGFVLFPDALLDVPPTQPLIVWTLTATTTEGSTPTRPVVNRCAMTNPTNPLYPLGHPQFNQPMPPTDDVINPAVGLCEFSIGGNVVYSTPTGGSAQAMPGGSGVTLELRDVTGAAVADPVTVTSYSAPDNAFTLTNTARSNQFGVYDVVVTSHPAGHHCVVSNGGGHSVYVTAITSNPENITATGSTTRPALNVYCRAVPTGANVLSGTYRLITSTTTVGANPPVTAKWTTNPAEDNRQVSSNILTFFDDGSFLYGTHAGSGSTVSAHIEHGFYDYNPDTGTLRFTIHTDTNTSTTFNGTVFNTGTTNIPLAGLSATPGIVTVGSGSTAVRTATMTGVQRGTEDGQRTLAGTFVSGANSWYFGMTEPESIDNQMTGAWITQDHRRFWVYDFNTTYGYHAGVNGGAPNLQNACYPLDDFRASTGFYSRRGSSTGCYPFNRPAAGAFFLFTTTESVDFAGNGGVALLPGFVGRIPGGQTAFDARSPSPIYFHIAPAATFFSTASPDYFPEVPTGWCNSEILGLRATLHAKAIDSPVYFCRTRAN